MRMTDETTGTTGTTKTTSIEPRIRGNICLHADPAGCARQVRLQVDAVRARVAEDAGLDGAGRWPRRALIIGASNGYGLAARIVAAFGGGSAATAGVLYERVPDERRQGAAGWYNNLAFEQQAAAAGRVAVSVNGDAFCPEVKQRTMELLRERIGPPELIVYSIAAPRRVDPITGEVHLTAVKPIGQAFCAPTIDINTGALRELTAPPASAREIDDTIKVMGGEDWCQWIDALAAAELLPAGATTVALSYVGPAITAPIYREGTIGRAKQHLEQTARLIGDRHAGRGLRALISVNKALVTRASAVIPAVTLYISLLYRVMKRKGLHENCIEQMWRLAAEHLYAAAPPPRDEQGRIRLDDLELRQDVQREVAELWQRLAAEGSAADGARWADIDGLRSEFLRHHGFGSGADQGQAAAPDQLK